MSEIKKSYYAILTADVRYCKDISANAKLLFAEITALCNEKGYCWASNNYFAELYSVSKSSVSRWFSELSKNGFIKIQLIRDENNEVKERRVYLQNIKNDDTPIRKNDDTPIRKNSYINTTTSNSVKKEFDNSFSEIEKHFLETYNNLFEQNKVINEKPIINYGQLKKNIKPLIKSVGVEKIKKAIDNACFDNWTVTQGFSLTTIISASQINKHLNYTGVTSSPKQNNWLEKERAANDSGVW